MEEGLSIVPGLARALHKKELFYLRALVLDKL
jgi:hypothetical protein